MKVDLKLLEHQNYTWILIVKIAKQLLKNCIFKNWRSVEIACSLPTTVITNEKMQFLSPFTIPVDVISIDQKAICCWLRRAAVSRPVPTVRYRLRNGWQRGHSRVIFCSSAIAQWLMKSKRNPENAVP